MASIQSKMRDNFCWGCGQDNHDGLRLESEWDGAVAVARWTPAAVHAAGPRHFLNGGIIATVIDCHGICTAVADAHRRDSREIGTEPLIWYATTGLHVEYLRPTPLAAELTLHATVAEVDGRRSVVDCTLHADGKDRARGRVEAVQVSEDWRQAPA